MSESALRVVKYIVENSQRAASMSIGELAKASGSNKSAIVRVCKLSGYQGYRGLRTALIENKGALRGAQLIGLVLPSGVEGDDKLLKLARDVIKANIEVLQDAFILLDEETLRRTADAILGAKHVLLVGFGASVPVIQDAYQRFLRLQIPVSTCSDAAILKRIVVNNGPDDLLFCISYSGADRDILEALDAAKGRRSPTIILTSVRKSSATALSEMVLVSAARRTTRAAESVAARVAQLVVIDIICAIIDRGKDRDLGKSRAGL